MGDRALVQFSDGMNFSPICYLHWHGSAVPTLIAKTRQIMHGRSGDLDYTFARFVGVCHEAIPGNLSLGAFVLPIHRGLIVDDSHGDAGCFIVDCRTWEVDAFGGYGSSFTAEEPS